MTHEHRYIHCVELFERTIMRIDFSKEHSEAFWSIIIDTIEQQLKFLKILYLLKTPNDPSLHS